MIREKIKKHKNAISTAALVYVAASWGSTFTVVKDSLGSINPVLMVGYRFAIAAIIIMLYLMYKNKNLFQNIKQGLILGILMFGMYVPQTVGLLYTKASNSGFITGMYILFIPFFSFFIMKRKFEKSKIIPILLSLIGMYLLTGGIKGINIGDIITLGTAAFCALHILAADFYVKKDIDVLVITFQQFAVTSILSLIISMIFRVEFKTENTNVWWATLFLALFPTISAFIIQMYSQKFVSPFKVAAIFALEPIFALIMAVWFGNEEIRLTGLAGGGLIIAGIIFSELKIINSK